MTSSGISGRTDSWGNTERRKSWVSRRAPTMERTVSFRYSVFRSSSVMIFSQSHWST